MNRATQKDRKIKSWVITGCYGFKNRDEITEQFFWGLLWLTTVKKHGRFIDMSGETKGKIHDTPLK
jgi:hypothetical protein